MIGNVICSHLDQARLLVRTHLTIDPDQKPHSACANLSKYLTLVMLNNLRYYAHFQFLANQFTGSRLLILIKIFIGKQCRSRSVGFSRSQLIWIYTVCKCRTYPGSAGQGLRENIIQTYFLSYDLDPIYTGLVTTVQVLYLLEICCRG